METPEQFYRNLCSLETVRSGKRGFFRDFSERVADVAGEAWISKVFGRLPDDEARVRAIFADEKIRDTVAETLNRTKILYRAKDENASRATRLAAYECAANGEWEKAVLLFSQAVLRAPPAGKCEAVDRGSTLPLALLGRAEAFAALNEHALALEDARLAEEEEVKLPERFRGELAKRRTECEERVRSNERRVTCPGQFDGAASTKTARDEKRDARLPRLSGGSHSRLPAASALLDVRETPTAGKQAIAVEEIGPGDTLVVEPPLAACLLPEFFGTRCHHCFSGLRAPIGCPDCSSVAFCGRTCRDQATASYHKYECRILALLIGSGMSALSTLALRMVTQAGPIQCENIFRALRARRSEGVDEDSTAKQRLDGLAETATGTEAGREREPDPNPVAKLSKSAKRRIRKKMLRDSKYQEEKRNTQTEEADKDRQRRVDLRAYELVMHENKRTARDFFERSLMAAFLLKCLRTVGFFDISAEPDRETERVRSTAPTGPEIAVAALLSKHLQLLQFNAHEVFETRPGKEHRFRGSKPVYIGVAIYPTVARFNHDCYPAVTRTIVIRATRSLRVGDTVAENYGPIFTKRNLEERRRSLLGRYWFACECTACRENWPRFETLTNDDARLRCPTKGCEKLHRRPREPTKPIDCSTCRRKVDLREPLAFLRECELGYERGFEAMEEEQPDKALDAFLAAAKTFHRVAVPPHRDTHLAEIAVNACMSRAPIRHT